MFNSPNESYYMIEVLNETLLGLWRPILVSRSHTVYRKLFPDIADPGVGEYR
jgi:hypothetical protein